MEKLIELLNEFINKTIFPYDRGAKCIGYENHLFLFETGTDVLEDTVISKRYLFIKWLVENDKIDLNKVKDKTIVKEIYEDYNSDLGISADFYPIYETLLMLLSISDTPIDDLLLYLK